MHIVVVEDATPALRLLAWGLREEGFTVETCLLDNVTGCVAAMSERPAAAIVNMIGALDVKRACVATVHGAVSRVIDLCATAGEACGADVGVEGPYRIETIIQAIKRLSSEA